MSDELYCNRCGEPISGNSFPVDPVWSLPHAVVLVPCKSIGSLYSALSRYKQFLGAPIYRRDRSGRRHRYLTNSQIRLLRELLNRPYKNE